MLGRPPTLRSPEPASSMAAAADEGVTPAARRGARPDAYALFWGLPLALWQGAFFLAPLAFLVVMTFWSVKNFRLDPGFDTVNWVNMWSKGYVVDTYLRTLGYGALAAAVCSVVAFSRGLRARLQGVARDPPPRGLPAHHAVLHKLHRAHLFLAAGALGERHPEYHFSLTSASARWRC